MFLLIFVKITNLKFNFLLAYFLISSEYAKIFKFVNIYYKKFFLR